MSIVPTTRRHRAVGTALTGAAVVLAVLAACGGSGDADAADHNDADVAFAQQMIPHHQQAVQMSDVVLDAPAGSVAPEVVALAEQIKAAQAPEIEQMQGWLDDWDAEVGGTEGMDGMDGMLTGDELDALEQAEGAALATQYLTGMVGHHEGAVTMAQTELDEGSSPEAQELAEQIIETQQAEIEQMQTLLGSEGG